MGPYGGIAGISLAASVTLTAGDIHHIVLRHNLFFFFFNIPSPCLVLLSTEHRDKKGEGIGVC